MSGSVNKVILIGNLGKDPEIRYLDNGVLLANFSLATSEVYTDKNTGQKIENTDWHNIVLWRGLATIAEKYLKKGHKVYIEGKLKNRTWQDKDGNKKYTVEIIGENLTMLNKLEKNNVNSKPTYPQSIEKIENSYLSDDFTNNEDLPF